MSNKRKGTKAPLPKGLPCRLSKGAGTHLASWLQASNALSPEEAQVLLDENGCSAKASVRGARALEGLLAAHGKKAGHAKPITDVAFSGEILVSKDASSMRLWRASGDYTLLRVVAAGGKHVAIHRSGQFIVSGTRRRRDGGEEEQQQQQQQHDEVEAEAVHHRTDPPSMTASGEEKQHTRTKDMPPPKIWGPAGGSAFSVGKKSITTGVC